MNLTAAPTRPLLQLETWTRMMTEDLLDVPVLSAPARDFIAGKHLKVTGGIFIHGWRRA